MIINDFDKLYCLSLTSEKDRYNNCLKQFNDLNLSVSFWYTCKRKWNRIENVVPGIKLEYYDNNCGFKNDPYGYSGFFNCTLEEYTIIKTSYERGMNHIAIMEDDIQFIDDKEKINKYLNNIPDDFNIIKFHNLYNGTYMLNNGKLYNDVLLDKLNLSYQYYSTLFFALDRKGMELYIDYFDNVEFTGGDYIFKKLYNKYKVSDYKFYNINDIICEPNSKFKSNIIK